MGRGQVLLLLSCLVVTALGCTVDQLVGALDTVDDDGGTTDAGRRRDGGDRDDDGGDELVLGATPAQTDAGTEMCPDGCRCQEGLGCQSACGKETCAVACESDCRLRCFTSPAAPACELLPGALSAGVR
jgi:hypothetical protein